MFHADSQERRTSSAPNAARGGSSGSQSVVTDPRWGAIVARDARADGQFYYAVASTGVYCRPSCAASSSA